MYRPTTTYRIWPDPFSDSGSASHFLLAPFFAIHALHIGRQMCWLIILFSFPLLGSIVYFAVVLLPHS